MVAQERNMEWECDDSVISRKVVLNDYPSGLNYYYFVSTLISVGTMILLRKTTDETKLLAILEAKKNIIGIRYIIHFIAAICGFAPVSCIDIVYFVFKMFVNVISKQNMLR